MSNKAQRGLGHRDTYLPAQNPMSQLTCFNRYLSPYVELEWLRLRWDRPKRLTSDRTNRVALPLVVHASRSNQTSRRVSWDRIVFWNHLIEHQRNAYETIYTNYRLNVHTSDTPSSIVNVVSSIWGNASEGWILVKRPPHNDLLTLSSIQSRIQTARNCIFLTTASQIARLNIDLMFIIHLP